jgi:hypothetical protein
MLKIIATNPLFKVTKIDSIALLELFKYIPPLKLYYKLFKSIAISLSELYKF